ncbi:MAG: hypothetical protein UV95_C0001G0319 [Candidatus Falkowbacteria bacterium GW2011_GWF2_43_32]|nr:MAG: hypothetical protein UV95_C0001G0319 [Candidatus Falkowbacteria bacterium GW2011_GWF2_43_32]
MAVLLICLSFSGPLLAQESGTYSFSEDSGLNAAANRAGYDVAEASTVEDIIGIVIYLFLGLLGVIFFVLVLYGGFTWMIAQGNEEKVKKSTAVIMDALLGLIVVLAAYALSYFLINAFWK